MFCKSNKVMGNYLIFIGMIHGGIFCLCAILRFVKADPFLLSMLSPYIEMIIKVFVTGATAWRIHARGGNEENALLALWGFLFLFIQAIYYVYTNLYGKLVTDLFSIVSFQGFQKWYSQMHIFKYAPMLIGMILCLFITGIFLQKKFLIILSLLLGGTYILCILFDLTATFQISNEIKALVIGSAVLCHGMESVGLFLLGIYFKIIEGSEKKHVFFYTNEIDSRKKCSQKGGTTL